MYEFYFTPIFKVGNDRGERKKLIITSFAKKRHAIKFWKLNGVVMLKNLLSILKEELHCYSEIEIELMKGDKIVGLWGCRWLDNN